MNINFHIYRSKIGCVLAKMHWRKLPWPRLYNVNWSPRMPLENQSWYIWKILLNQFVHKNDLQYLFHKRTSKIYQWPILVKITLRYILVWKYIPNNYPRLVFNWVFRGQIGSFNAEKYNLVSRNVACFIL